MQGNSARFVKLRCARICLGITINQRFELPMLGAALAHIDLVIPKDYMSIDHPPAFRADTAGEFVKDIIRIFFNGFCGQLGAQ